ncbi:unnamed protein product, partial [Chrysoparadoxa australica]
MAWSMKVAGMLLLISASSSALVCPAPPWSSRLTPMTAARRGMYSVSPSPLSMEADGAASFSFRRAGGKTPAIPKRSPATTKAVGKGKQRRAPRKGRKRGADGQAISNMLVKELDSIDDWKDRFPSFRVAKNVRKKRPTVGAYVDALKSLRNGKATITALKLHEDLKLTGLKPRPGYFAALLNACGQDVAW